MNKFRDSPENIRRRNLSRVLRTLHKEGARSRASLTEELGLNRSTIADLVGELVRAELVFEVPPPADGRVGRPSPVVTPSPEVLCLAVNPEVDALELAAVSLDRTIRARERLEMDHLLEPAECAALVAGTLGRWLAGPLRGARVVGLGLAVPGLVRRRDGLVRTAPHLRWTDAPLRDLVAASTGLPVLVGNDASLGASAEHLFGAAAGIENAVYLNGGASGIGGGIVINGALVGGAGGYAGEFGQNQPSIASPEDRRVAGGTLEDEVSRARLLEALALARADDQQLAEALAGPGGGAAAPEVARQRGILAATLSNLVNVLNPDLLVLGGFLAVLADSPLPGLGLAELESLVRDRTMAAPGEDFRIAPAALADDRLLIGAAEAAFEFLLEDPAPQRA